MESESLAKHTLHLFEGDFAKLGQHYPEVGASKIIRKLVRLHLEKLDPQIDVKKLMETINE